MLIVVNVFSFSKKSPGGQGILENVKDIVKEQHLLIVYLTIMSDTITVANRMAHLSL